MQWEDAPSSSPKSASTCKPGRLINRCPPPPLHALHLRTGPVSSARRGPPPLTQRFSLKPPLWR
eukprot:116423-Prorocentrum_minimum.AAC.1